MKKRLVSVIALITALALMPALSVQAKPSEQQKSQKNSSGSKKKLEGIKIGIDPGHQKKGNSELEPNAPGSSTKKAKVSSGTQGKYSKTPEYEINLKVALLLRDMLIEEGAEVIMTHDKADVNIPNSERATMMNKAKVDLVLRIHCDGNNNSSVKGSSMLVPSGKYTKDIEKKSGEYGATIHKAFLAKTKAKDRGVRKRDDQTGFNWSKVPVCTIEMGFMTNKDEDKKLNTEDYQKLCAQGLLNGIIDCFD